MSEPLKPGVNVSSGDKGVDRSQTTVDNSSRVTTSSDDHSVRTSSVDDHSARTTTSTNTSSKTKTVSIDASDNRRKSHVSISGGTLLGVVGFIALVLVVMWLVPRGGVPSASPVSSAQALPLPLAETGQRITRTVTPAVEQKPQMEEPPAAASQPPTAPERPSDRPERRGEAPAPIAAQPVGAPVRPAEPPRLDPATFINRGMMLPGSTVVLMVDQSRGADAILTQQVAALVQGSEGLFKPAFVADGLFSRVHQGDADLLRELGLTTDVARVLLGIRTTSYSATEVAGASMVRAAVTLSVRVIRPVAGFASGVAAAREVGAGFDQDSALEVATRNALKTLAAELAR